MVMKTIFFVEKLESFLSLTYDFLKFLGIDFLSKKQLKTPKN